MKTKIFTLCDFAKDYNGQLSINGTFNVIKSNVFPTVPRSIFLACQFELCENIVGSHNVNIILTDLQTNKIIIDEKLRLEIGQKNESTIDKKRFYTNLVLNLENISFDAPGTFEFKVSSDEVTETLELYITQD
ncbi:MAG: hypothetical protein K2H15_06540 [Muribaculaceae bacterium]|nr:hypothetical protein [Muribaculaceae bacterium]